MGLGLRNMNIINFFPPRVSFELHPVGNEFVLMDCNTIPGEFLNRVVNAELLFGERIFEQEQSTYEDYFLSETTVTCSPTLYPFIKSSNHCSEVHIVGDFRGGKAQKLKDSTVEMKEKILQVRLSLDTHKSRTLDNDGSVSLPIAEPFIICSNFVGYQTVGYFFAKSIAGSMPEVWLPTFEALYDIPHIYQFGAVIEVNGGDVKIIYGNLPVGRLVVKRIDSSKGGSKNIFSTDSISSLPTGKYVVTPHVDTDQIVIGGVPYHYHLRPIRIKDDFVAVQLKLSESYNTSSSKNLVTYILTPNSEIAYYEVLSRVDKSEDAIQYEIAFIDLNRDEKAAIRPIIERNVDVLRDLNNTNSKFFDNLASRPDFKPEEVYRAFPPRIKTQLSDNLKFNKKLRRSCLNG